MSTDVDLDDALIAIVVTAFLIRSGGRVEFSPTEWETAVKRASTMYCHREGPEENVLVVLMPKEPMQ